MKNILYNPSFIQYKQPLGAIKNSDDVLITIKITQRYHIHNFRIIIKNDDKRIIMNNNCELIRIENGYQVYIVRFTIKDVGLYWYYFEFDDIYGHHYIGANSELDACLSNLIPNPWQLSICGSFIGQVDWFKGKIMYQIMVDRFFRDKNTPIKSNVVYHENWRDIPEYRPVQGKILNNDFFGGNLSGVTKKLDYLKSLSVGVIYLNPIFEAASNHKYDTGDYLKIDSMFGNEDDFIELCTKAKQRGIAIILDGVFNHTGDDSIYFNKYGHYPSLGAYQSISSNYFQWYKFINHPDEYESWWGINILPSVNQNNPEFLAFITGTNGVINKWLKLGAAGFRIDVIDELTDNFIEKIYLKVKEENHENIVIGEVWEDASNKISYGRRRKYFSGNQVDSVMNYPLKNAIISYLRYNHMSSLKIQMRKLINNYPKQTLDLLMNHLGTHDTMRLINNFAISNPNSLSKDQQAHYKMRNEEYEKGVRMLKLATALQFTLPGVPSIYYGDEIGLQGFRDPFCRNTFDWEGIDQDIYEWYIKLGEIRSDDVYKEGIYQEELIERNLFAFSRIGKDYKIITIINNSDQQQKILFSQGYDLLDEKDINDKLFIGAKTAKIIKVLLNEKIRFA